MSTKPWFNVKKSLLDQVYYSRRYGGIILSLKFELIEYKFLTKTY